MFYKIHWKTLLWESLFYKVLGTRQITTQTFSSEFCGFNQSRVFIEGLRRAGFQLFRKQNNLLTSQGLFQKIRACVRHNQKRARKSSERAQLWIFTPYFSQFWGFRTLHTPKWHVFLEFLVENKAFHFSKKVLHAGAACKKWLKKPCQFPDQKISKSFEIVVRGGFRTHSNIYDKPFLGKQLTAFSR